MSYFKNLSEQICDFLNSLSHERRMVMFGDSNRFEEWLIVDQQVIDNVSILNPLSKIIEQGSSSNLQFVKNQCWDAKRKLVQFLSYRSIL